MRLSLYIAALSSLLIAPGPLFGQNAVQQPGVNSNQQRVQQNNETARVDNVGPTKAMAPNWPQLNNQEHNIFVTKLLDLWQSKSDEVKQYQCNFNRYDYDTKIVNWRDPRNNRLAAASIMTGEIRFAAPDKASYETTQVLSFAGPPEQEGGEAKYEPVQDSSIREKWICDGKAIHEFNFQQKKLYEVEIPPEMQGKGLVNSPIPFLFGASKDDILNRFWVRIITPDGAQNEYWLEAVPKKIDDARNYKKLELVLSRDELFLPIMLHIYSPNYNPAENNLTSRIFEFTNRTKNGRLIRLQDFFNRFVRPSTPIGWERVNRKSMQAHQHFDPSRLTRPAQRPGQNQVK